MEEASAGTEVRTFLIADVRGYTRFTLEHGDEAAARLADTFAEISREVVTGRGGEVIELRGDEALAVFTSTRQALRAAVELQDRVGEAAESDPALAMKVGVGLDAGEAVPVQGGFRGAALNLAARLCSLAGPGEVLASDTVVNLARKVEGLVYTERGAVQLKGFVDPVRVIGVGRAVSYQLSAVSHELPAVSGESSVVSNQAMGMSGELSDSVPPSPVEGAAGQPGERGLPIGGFLGALPANALVGRGEELGKVLAAVEAVAEGHGRLVLLAGEPGAGKTRLAQEVTLEVRNREFLVAAGICYESRQAVPYYPFLDGLAALYGAAPVEIRAAVPQRWPYLGRLLPEAPIAGPVPVVETEQDQERLFRAVTGFMQTLAQVSPVALLLDDLQWADASSLDLLRHLARHTRGDRLLILGTYRDMEVGRQAPLEGALLDLTREQLVERVAVRRLPVEGTEALIGAIFGEEEVSGEFVRLVHRHTEGNPFFTQEVLRAMVERGDVFRRDGAWDRRGVEEIQVPESVRAVIGQRLSRLGDPAQELLREASVLGQTFAFDQLQEVSGRGETEVDAALEEARAAGLVREADRDSYVFNHALTQQALYEELSSRRKRRLHLAAGEALEQLPARKRRDRAGELAWHFLEADEPERALRYSLLAGDRASELFAWRDAKRHYQTALELARELEDRPQVAEASFKLAMQLWSEGPRPGEMLTLLEQAAVIYAELDDPVMEGRALQPAAILYRAHRPERVADVMKRLQRLLPRVAEREPSRDKVLFYHFLANVYTTTGDYAETVAIAERGVEAARALGDEVLVTRMELRRADALGTTGQVGEAIRVAQEVLPRAEAMGDLETLSEALFDLAEFSMMAGYFESSRDYRQREHEVYERQGRTFETAFALCNLGQVEMYLGDWQAAWDHMERGLALAESVDNQFVPLIGRYVLGTLAVLRGDWDEGARVLEEIAIAPIGTLQIHRYIDRELAQLDLLKGLPEMALARLEPLVEGADPEDNDVTLLLPVLAWAYLENGTVDRAVECAAETVQRARGQQNALALVDALRVFGVALGRQGRGQEAAAAFTEDLTLARRMPYPYAQASALFEWGRLDAAAGDSRQAGARLEEALAIFRRLGAGKDVERTRLALEELVS